MVDIVACITAHKPHRSVAVQVAFERANFETGFSTYRFQGMKPGGFELWLS
jgi:hypothetical protein